MVGTSSLGDHRGRSSGMTRTTLPVAPPSVHRRIGMRDVVGWLNLIMAAIHSGLAATTLAVTKNIHLEAPVFRVTFAINFTMDHANNVQQIEERVRNGSLSAIEDVFGVDLEALDGGLPIAWLTFWFFAITAAAHAGAVLLYPAFYFSLLERKCNPLRWAEYSVTASLMWLILAQAFAFIDVNSLVLSTAMIVVTMASGLQCEYVARPSADGADSWTLPLATRLCFLLPGTLLYGTAAAMLCISMVTGVRGSLPSFVLPTVTAQLIFFGSFAVVLLWQQCNPPSRWIYGECMFQALSLLSKAVLGIVLIVNILVYEDYMCVFDDRSCE